MFFLDKVYHWHSIMFSRSEKIIAHPGVFHVVGVTQYIFVILHKMAEIEFFNVAHQRTTCLSSSTRADLGLKLVKIARQFPLKVDKSDFL